MSAKPAVLVTALLVAACASQSGTSNPPNGGAKGEAGGSGAGGSAAVAGSTGGPSAGTGGTGGQAGQGDQTTAGASGGLGSAGTGGGKPADAGNQADGADPEGKPADAASAPDMASSGAPMAGGNALLVVGTIPLRGTDVQFRDAIKAKGIEVIEKLEKDVTTADAENKRVVLLSYSMQSTALKADLADVKSPIFVVEHNLLERLGMTASGNGHGFQLGLTQLTITSDDPVLAAGFPKGDLTVYGKTQEMFWGVPSEAAIKVAHLKGNANRVVYFAYPQGAMMVGRTAPGKRLQFFHATHAPPPVDTLYLNENGLKLLSAALDWCLK